MSRRPQSPRPAPQHDRPDIDLLQRQIAALTLCWRGVAPPPPSLSEALEGLTTTVEELQAMHEELARSQQAAAESQRRYQELFESVPDAYLVTDLQGLILEANRAAATLFHLDQARLLGLPLAVCVAWEERRTFRTQLARLQHGDEVREWVIRMQPPHHPAVPVACHVAPARDAEGRLVGLRWLLRDLKDPPPAPETVGPRVRELTPELEPAELRLRELHHRMKNNLQIVSSLLDWQAESTEAAPARAVFEACQGRIRAMALIHELLCRAGDPERIELGDYLQRLALHVFEAHGIDRERVHLTLEAEPIAAELRTAIPCGLLVHEVLFNCLKHAFPAQQAGAVTITLRAEPAGQVTVAIRDTGVGLPLDVDTREADGFGLYLIRGLTEQLRGTLVVTRDRGTCVTLRFPV